jgi:hypothetical protein
MTAFGTSHVDYQVAHVDQPQLLAIQHAVKCPDLARLIEPVPARAMGVAVDLHEPVVLWMIVPVIGTQDIA